MLLLLDSRSSRDVTAASSNLQQFVCDQLTSLGIERDETSDRTQDVIVVFNKTDLTDTKTLQVRLAQTIAIETVSGPVPCNQGISAENCEQDQTKVAFISCENGDGFDDFTSTLTQSLKAL